MEKHISVLCLLNFLLQQAGCEDLVNIALNKTPTLEFPAGTFWDVSHSVDGMTECAPPVTGQHYSATVDAIDPWWQLDLGTMHIIKAMHLLGRPDTHKQLGGFRLWAGLDKDNLPMVYEDNWRAYNNGNIWVNSTIIARVIRIDLPRDTTAKRINKGPLTLCEVEVLISSTEPNIKHTSNTSGSDIYGGFGSNLAIDGKYPSASEMTPELCNCCSITTGTSTLWWTIDFGQPRLIRRVDITGRMDEANHYQSNDLSIFISSASPAPSSGVFGDLVWKITSSESGTFFRHTFPSPRVFRYMSITQQGSSTHYMTICEVDFNAVECPPGRYGSNCSDTCGQCIPIDTICSVSNGTCPTGCSPGFDYTRDKTCKTECQPGHYGSNCSDTCGQCIPNNTICSVSNGTCPTGCSPGFDYRRDKTCTTACQPGHYGSSCSQTCGHCKKDTNTCNKTDGSCPAGCAAGYNYTSDNKCKTECQHGHYGPSCLQTCGHCVGDTTLCNKTDGSCPAGCAAGYNYTAGNKCNIECSTGHYGLNCSNTCGHCNEDTNICNKIDGSCPAGCSAGYNHTADSKCNTVCSKGHYGVSCQYSCGSCKKDSTCLATNGTCTFGCAPGYYDTTDRKCETGCKPGHYGQNCSQTCSHCVGDTTLCNKIDGSCPGGCAAGYNYTAGNKCNIECSTGHYGLNCSETCGHCNEDICNKIDGSCPAGCSAGYNHTADNKCNTVCSKGHYGVSCQYSCGSCKKYSTCLATNGTCSFGCAPGYYDTTDRKCESECKIGHFGQNCSQTCGHCVGDPTLCNRTDGSCPAGCAAGYNYTAGNKCNIECSNGHYGLNCSETCGHCNEDRNTCNKTDGSCPAGCAAGYNHTADNKCNTECQSGHYGLNCSQTCGHCFKGIQSCRQHDGSCPAGCAAGYNHTEDNTCKTLCKPGHYGKNCSNTCGNCIDGKSNCTVTLGECPNGCLPGYNHTADKACKTTCRDGNFGQSCSETCGQCSGGSKQCSKTDGVCLLQCADGFKGSKCLEATSYVATIVGVVVPVIVIVLSLVVLVVVLKRRGRLAKRSTQRTNGETASEFVNLETLVRERETQNKTTRKAKTSDEKKQSNEKGGYYSFNPGDHVKNSINIRGLWDYITKNRATNFNDLFVEFHAISGGLQFECYAAQRDENVGKNKYRNMYPYDYCRVKLKVPEGQTDYINASHVDGYERVQKFIAAQGPQKGTIEDFWLMVWQQGVRKVVMLTNVFEMGKDKCEQYWPNEGASIQYGGIEVTSKETTEKSDYSIRKFELRMEHEKTRRVDQFHFKSWPDKDVPDSTWCLVNFWRVAMKKDHGKSPIVVHCSAGIGRTGTFIALDALYHQAMAEGGIRPVAVIETLRRQRINMVQTKYQYAFLHEALADALLVGTHFFWASQLPSVCNFFRARNPEATVTRAHEQFKLICECIASSKEQQQTSSSAAAENIYEETGEPMVEPEYGNISTVQSEISEYRPRTKDRNSASIQQMNAIYLPNYAEASTYILAETPCDSSLSDLWTLVEEQNVTTIVNLTETMHPYFQTSCTLGANGGKPVGRFVVNVVKEVKHKEYTIRSIVYKEQDKENNTGFTVKMFSLSAWQQGAECPGDPDPLMALLEEVNKWHPYVSEAKPVLFICGDGRTRCGLVAAILNESQRMRNEDGHVNIVETVMMMKKRAGDVISAEQLQFLYEAVFAYALRMGYALDTDHNNT